MITRDQIVREARTWKGTRFHHQGRAKGVGCDCAGLVVGTLRNLGLSYSDVNNYGHFPKREEFEAVLDRNLKRITFDERRPGDILFFVQPKRSLHLAVLVDRDHIIHAYAGAGRCVFEQELTGDLRDPKNIAGTFRVPEVAD